MIDVEKATEEFRQKLESGYFGDSDKSPLSGKEIDDVLKAVNTVQKHQSKIDLDDTGYDEGYKDGLHDAWDTAKKIYNTPAKTRREIFPLVNYDDILENLTPEEALEKIKAYGQDTSLRQRVIELADEVGIHRLYAMVKDVRGE